MSLLTPPNSSHRTDKDKENKFSGVGPFTRTVVWASHDSFHCLSTPPKDAPGSSKHRPVAKKSILKKNCLSLAVPEVVKQRDVTPVPSDALLDLHYLDYPVSQILAECPHNNNLGQLIEGYNVLAARLRASVTNATDADASWPLFQPLRKNAQAFVDAIVRDLGRAFIDPLAPSSHSSKDEVLPKVTLPSPEKSPSKKKGGMTEEQVKHARDLCTTSHSAIKLLTFILSVSAVFNVFHEGQLRDILTAVLAIPLADDLPTPNARKTCALSICLLQAQRLPATILGPAADRIAYALRRGIDGELGKEGKKGSASDSLKAIHDLCIHEPTIFVPAFAPLVPSILSKLLANTLAIRTQACHALGGFALGSTYTPVSPIHTQVSRAVATYITTATRSPSKNSPEKPNEAAISRTLKTTLASEDPQHPAQGPVWALSVLASFIVLLGSRLSEDMRVIKIISCLLCMGLKHKKSSVRALGYLLIRPLAWVYFQPPLPVDSDEELEVDDEVRVQTKEARRIHLKMLQTAVECKAGVSTIGALLGEELSSSDPLWCSIEILQQMAAKPGRTCQDAVDVMQYMVSFSENTNDNGADYPWSGSLLLPRSLFSSFPGLLTAEFKSLKGVVEPIFEQVSTVEDIRCLTREEMSTQWVFKGMMRTWWIALGASPVFDGSELPSNAVEIWAGLLKANVGYFQETGDDDASAMFGLRAVKYLVDALEDSELDFVPKRVPATASAPADTIPSSDDFVLGRTTHCTNAELRLVVVNGLWQTMKTIFPQGPLIPAAEALLTCLMKKEASLVPENARLDGVFESDSGESTRNKWVSLCVSVLGVCGAGALRAFWGYEEGGAISGAREEGFKWTQDFTNAVWRSSVEQWRDGEGHWEGAVVLLGVPFTGRHTWNIGSDDYSLWEDLLNYTTNKALDHGVDSSTILDNIADFVSCFQTPDASPTSSIRLVDNLLSHLESSEMRDIPQNLFELVSDTMRATYPPEPRNKAIAMWLARSLMGVVENCPVEFCLSVLQMLKESLCVWLGDEYGAWTEDHFTYDIIPLYQHILVRIRALPENLATLEELSDILDAIFRQRVPLVAAEAFIDYWNISYARMPVPKQGWSLVIRHCLSSVGLLPDEPKVEQQKEFSTLEPAFVATVSLPRTPISFSFATPPAVFEREAGARIQSPQRPQKLFGPFPIIPSSPVSPLLRRSSDHAGRRTPLSSIQLCGSPSKRRRLAVDNVDGKDEKENLVVVSVVDRIAAMTPGAAKKRRREEVEDEAAEQKSGSSGKKLKSSMKPRTRSTSKKASLHASPACSVASSNESEDERRWVEAALTQMVPFPVTEAQDDGYGGFGIPSLPQRKRHVRTVNNSEHQRLRFQCVFIPSGKRKTEREHTTSLDGSGGENLSSSSRVLDLRKRLPMRRSVSIPESMLTSKTEKKRKRQDSDADGDCNSLDLYDLIGSDPLPALRLPLPPPPARQFRKAYSLPSSDSDVHSTSSLSSSDDDPYIGQVTPHHLISPALQRRVSIGHSLLTSKTRKTSMGLRFGENFGDTTMPGSDDSVTTSGSETESPTKGVVTRQTARTRNAGQGLTLRG
ncbi:hypothetical protein BYT27DRAFT_7205042 [Phlegmacium glaucopus]|nr:hypothetical protein BYT27DRAFT_7205042 [Phlegmacium glaucopus]